MKKLLVLAAACSALFAQAQNFPSKPINIVVPFAAGGPTDRVARDLAEAMRKSFDGVSIIIDNVAGAGSSIGSNKVAKAAPDGYTLCSTILVWQPCPPCCATCRSKWKATLSIWAW